MVTPGELADKFKNHPNAPKAPGFELVTGEILKTFKRKALVNARIRLNYVADPWKSVEVIMIPKPGKKSLEVESDRPILLLPIMLS